MLLRATSYRVDLKKIVLVLAGPRGISFGEKRTMITLQTIIPREIYDHRKLKHTFCETLALLCKTKKLR